MNRIMRFYSNPASANRVTVVGEFDQQESTLKLAVARTSKRDQFVKKLGAAKAEGRLKSHNALVLKVPECKPSIFVSIAQRISTMVENNLDVNLNNYGGLK
jgi:hypothetical protein